MEKSNNDDSGLRLVHSGEPKQPETFILTEDDYAALAEIDRRDREGWDDRLEELTFSPPLTIEELAERLGESLPDDKPANDA